MPVAGCNPKSQRFVKVIKTEEKDSDVNLATHLLSDGYKGKIDVAVLVTNDSDLVGPVKIISKELKLTVGMINPHKKPSRILIEQASFIKQIRKGVLSNSQFPKTLKDSKGTFHKPDKW